MPCFTEALGTLRPDLPLPEGFPVMDLEGSRQMPRKLTRRPPMEYRSTKQNGVFGFDNPHELIGLPAHETNVTTIIAAAQARLDVMRASTGSEIEVKEYVISQIITAREAMLARARQWHLPDETSAAHSQAIVRIGLPGLN